MCQASNLNGIWRNKFIQMNDPSSVLTCDLALHMHPSCALSTKKKQNKAPDNRLVCMSVQKETAAYMQAIFFDPILLTTAKLGTDFQLPISSYRVVTYVWGSNPSTLCPDCTEICAMYARMKHFFFFFQSKLDPENDRRLIFWTHNWRNTSERTTCRGWHTVAPAV